VVVCTAGDFYGTADVFNEAKSHFVARMMEVLGYDAIGIGEMDLNFGLSALVKDARDYHLPVVCANLIARGDSLRVRRGGPADKDADRMGTAFPPYVIVERGGTRFGFLGLLSPATRAVRGAAETPKKVESLTYVIDDPLTAAKSMVPKVRAACDIMVVLAHMSQEEATALAQAVPGIDFVVLGHDAQGQPLGEPVMVGETALVRATYQGMHIGELGVMLGARGKMESYRNRIYPLLASFPDDPEMAKMLDEFDAQNRESQKELYAREQLKSADDVPGANRYLGVGSCQACHEKEFEIYMGTAHARAYQTLSSQFVHRDTNCVGCHVTGYGDAGGFAGVRPRGAMVDLVDVQCEACHGPGSEHARDGSYAARAARSCVKCHTENDDPDFDYDTYWPRVAH
jgi:hypothetical protein